MLGVDFINELTGWAVGTVGTIIKTTDGGESWEFQNSGISVQFNGVCFTDLNNGTVVGSKQTIIRTTNGGVTFVEDDNAIPSQPKNFHLCQNYPNPFNLSTRIQYSVNSTQNVTLKVYDLLGREVATLVNEEKPAGEYEVEFNTNRRSGEVRNLTSGIYFYQLKTGDYIATKKMVLLK